MNEKKPISLLEHLDNIGTDVQETYNVVTGVKYATSYHSARISQKLKSRIFQIEVGIDYKNKKLIPIVYVNSDMPFEEKEAISMYFTENIKELVGNTEHVSLSFGHCTIL